MTSQLAYVGLVMVASGLGSFYVTEHLAAYNVVNLIGGALCLLAAAVLAARRLRVVGGSDSPRVLRHGIGLIATALVLGVGLERLADWTGIQFDWTFSRRFEISDATRKACEDLGPGLRATLFHDPQDPRTRRSELLLDNLARYCDMEVRSTALDHESEEVDRFEIGSSNTIVIEKGQRFETVDRPTEGAIYEALYRLRSVEGGIIGILRGEGEGDPENTDDLGYSGLSTALSNEGYQQRVLVTPAMKEVPEEIDLVLSIAPRRRLRDDALAALGRYLDDGGRLVALLEPGFESGIEDLLASYGLASPNRLVVDPASGDVDAKVEGLNPVAYNYAVHPVTRGLNRNRMTFFVGVRSFSMYKVERDDRLERIVLSSPRAWLSDDLELLDRLRGKPEPDGARQDYQPLVVSGEFQRESGQTRIVAFGDSDFASNRYLRAVYNLDLVLNAVHWAASREAEITMRPKAGPPLHFPLPIADSLRTLYGVGLLVPEILLIAGGVVWLRRRSG